MWTHCTFCTRDLGRNEVVETFPVGRRLAFDAAKGRLWVVCKRCGGWNLTPLEERWEAVEDCEQLFRLVRTRVSTGELGLARLSEGLELVRIGRPLPSEFAAWRYGENFIHRHRQAMVVGAVAAAGVVTFGWAGSLLGGLVWPAVVGGGGGGVAAGLTQRWWNGSLTSTRVRVAPGRLRTVRGRQIRHARLIRSDAHGGAWPGWDLAVSSDGGWELITGPSAARVTARLIRQMNRAGASRKWVRQALTLIRMEGHPDDFLRALVTERGAPPGPPEVMRVNPFGREVKPRNLAIRMGTRRAFAGSLDTLDSVERLALEMAVNEEQERRAMEGELLLLENAWREAEEIAGIADGLLLPEGADEFIERERNS